MTDINVGAVTTHNIHHMNVQMLVVALSSIPAAVLAAAPPEPLTRHGCYMCHSDRDTEKGPAFAAVAFAHLGEHDAIETIANGIRSGIRSGGPWHMPPRPEISPAEARTMARYIMSLAPKPATPQQVKQSK